MTSIQAPELRARGEKKNKNKAGQTWMYDPDLISWVGVQCGQAASQFRLMLYLMGNKAGSWRCSTEDVCKRTGIADSGSLSKIKKKLADRGWIEYKQGEYITVLYDNLYKQMNSDA